MRWIVRPLTAAVAVLLVGTTACSAQLEGPRAPRATASSSAPGSSAAALVDGDPRSSRLGATWIAGAGDTQPWVQVDLGRERRVASVQVFGPGAEEPGTALLHGTLHFSDGSTVTVSSIDGGGGPATTVAFAPRQTQWVRLDLARTAPDARVSLRELAVYDVTTTPPRWPAQTAGYSATPEAAQCSSATAAAAPVAAIPGRVSLACPRPGSRVGDRATIVVRADPGRSVVLDGLLPARSTEQRGLTQLGQEVADAAGLASFDVDLSRFASGPVTLRASATDASADEPALDVQLVRTSGQPSTDASSVSHAPAGSTLQWDEEFDTPLSISGTGEGATYAASKPEKQGASQFGDAVFADPAAGADAIATIPGGYLRIRAQPIDGRSVNADAGQKALTGLLSSGRVGGSGFSAQYGYFEARMMGGPGPGTWPAFWMLDSEAATPRQRGAGEIDAVELYGHAPAGSCHTVHDWGVTAGESTAPRCIDPNGFTDWTMAWHTYGAQVTPTETIFTIDGVEVARAPALSKQDQPYFFLLDLALGGGWPVDLSQTGGVSDLYVDWIRVYT